MPWESTVDQCLPHVKKGEFKGKVLIVKALMIASPQHPAVGKQCDSEDLLTGI